MDHPGGSVLQRKTCNQILEVIVKLYRECANALEDIRDVLNVGGFVDLAYVAACFLQFEDIFDCYLLGFFHVDHFFYIDHLFHDL